MDVDIFQSWDGMGFVAVNSFTPVPADDVVVRNNRGPDPDDILLGEFGGKIDED